MESAARPEGSQSKADEYITVRETAAMLRLSEISIRRMLTQKKLKRFKCGARTLIKRSEALSLIKLQN